MTEWEALSHRFAQVYSSHFLPPQKNGTLQGPVLGSPLPLCGPCQTPTREIVIRRQEFLPSQGVCVWWGDFPFEYTRGLGER